MCPCYKEEFLGNGDEYIKQSIHDYFLFESSLSEL